MFCNGEACKNLGTCYCMMSDDYEKVSPEESKVAANWVRLKHIMKMKLTKVNKIMKTKQT